MSLGGGEASLPAPADEPRDEREGPVGDRPLIEARACRLGTPTGRRWPPLTLATEGHSVVLGGDSALLVGALSGVPLPALGTAEDAPETVEVIGGSLRVMGQDVTRGEHRRVLGVMPATPAMPRDMRARDLLRWTARLVTGRRRGAAALAEAALQRLALGPLASRRVASLGATERLGLALAAAVVGDPPALLLDHPFGELDEAGREWLSQALGDLARRKRIVIAVPRLATEGASGDLLRSASDIVVFHEGAVVAQDHPRRLLAEARTFTVTVKHGAAALEARLARDGVALRGGPLHFTAQLPAPLGPRHLIGAANETGAVVVACVPLVG